MQWSSMRRTARRRCRSRVGGVAALGVALALVLVGPAGAQTKTKTRMSEGRLVAVDPATGTMTVREKGKSVEYRVLLEGSVLVRTTATMNARPVRLEEIPPEAPVIVYWRPDDEDRKVRHARKVDAPKVDPEFLEDWD